MIRATDAWLRGDFDISERDDDPEIERRRGVRNNLEAGLDIAVDLIEAGDTADQRVKMMTHP